MIPQTADRLTRALIVVQLLATAAVIVTTVAAVVADVPLNVPPVVLGAGAGGVAARLGR